MVYTILGCDPGSKNFGYSVIRFKKVGNTFQFRVLETGILECALTELKGDVVGAINLFKRRVSALRRKYGITHFCAERFQSRGIKGKTIELVSFMLGLLTQVGIRNYLFITASQWKNQINRIFDLKEAYRTIGVPAHLLDATCIGIYFGCVVTQLKPFQTIRRNELLKRVRRATVSSG